MVFGGEPGGGEHRECRATRLPRLNLQFVALLSWIFRLSVNALTWAAVLSVSPAASVREATSCCRGSGSGASFHRRRRIVSRPEAAVAAHAAYAVAFHQPATF